MITLGSPLPPKHACGVDDGPHTSVPVPSPVPGVGHLSRALLGHSCQAPKDLGLMSGFLVKPGPILSRLHIQKCADPRAGLFSVQDSAGKGPKAFFFRLLSQKCD